MQENSSCLPVQTIRIYQNDTSMLIRLPNEREAYALTLGSESSSCRVLCQVALNTWLLACIRHATWFPKALSSTCISIVKSEQHRSREARPPRLPEIMLFLGFLFRMWSLWRARSVSLGCLVLPLNTPNVLGGQ